MKLPIRLLIAFVLAAVLFSACTVGGRNALIGKWAADSTTPGQPGLTQEFTLDGKYRWEVAIGVTAEATYQYTNDNSYLLVLPAGTGMATNWTFKVEGDKLTLTPLPDATTGQTASPETLVRVK